MTTLSSLRARKQQLLDRLRDGSGANQRAEVERLLAHVAAALDLLEEPAKQSRTPLQPFREFGEPQASSRA